MPRTQLAAVVLYNAYLAVGIARTWERTPSWCDNIRFLTATTVAAYALFAVSALVTWNMKTRRQAPLQVKTGPYDEQRDNTTSL